MLSDGYQFAGKTLCVKNSWTYNDTTSFIKKCYKKQMNAKEITNNLLDLFNQLYYFEPDDDTTVATLSVIRDKKVVLFSGPPIDRKRDNEIVKKLMSSNGKKIVCGGTTSLIVARELKRNYTSSNQIIEDGIPPLGYIDGIDLVTEGLITLQKTISILNHILDTTDYTVIHKMDAASRLAKILYEDSLHVKLMVGKSVNQAHQILELSNQLSNKVDILKELESILIKLGKIVEVEYF